MYEIKTVNGIYTAEYVIQIFPEKSKLASLSKNGKSIFQEVKDGMAVPAVTMCLGLSLYCVSDLVSVLNITNLAVRFVRTIWKR
jgi:hypothetical protein